MAEWIGRTISKVEIESIVGRGGMADVYQGRHTTLNRPVAVKVMRAYIADDKSLLARFTSEAQSVAALRHPNIVQVFDFDVVDGRAFMVMELLDGITLKDYLDALSKREERFRPESAARLLKPLADALDYAHQRGIVHRDVKPANIMLRLEGAPIDLNEPLGDGVEVVLTDFGVARIADEAGQTASGAIVGTPAYMSPEQVRGENIDARSDVYALGVVLYEMLAGRLPFDGDTQASILMRHITDIAPEVGDVTKDIQNVLDRALEKDVEKRFQTAGGLVMALYAALGISPTDTATGPYDTMHTLEMPVQARPASAEVTAIPINDTPPNRRALYVISVLGIIAVVVGILGLAGVFGPLQTVSTPSEGVEEGEGPAQVVDEEEVAGSVAEPTAAVSEGPAETDVSGLATFQDATLTAILRDLPAPPDDFRYQGWLIEPDAKSMALNTPLSEGEELRIVYVDPEGRTLLSIYSRFVLSIEPAESDPAEPGEIWYSAEVDADSLRQLRLLYEVQRDLPLKQAVLDGLDGQVSQYDSHLGFAVRAVTNGDLNGAKSHAEHMINISVGEGGDDFGDWNGDGLTQNPGDAVGLIPYLRILRESVEATKELPEVDAEAAARADILARRIDDILLVAEDAVSLAQRLTAVDSAEEAEPLAADLDTHRLESDIVVLVADADELRLLIGVPLVAVGQ